MSHGKLSPVIVETCVPFFPTALALPLACSAHMMRGFFSGHRRYVKHEHWIRDAGFLIGVEGSHDRRPPADTPI